MNPAEILHKVLFSFFFLNYLRKIMLSLTRSYFSLLYNIIRWFCRYLLTHIKHPIFLEIIIFLFNNTQILHQAFKYISTNNSLNFCSCLYNLNSIWRTSKFTVINRVLTILLYWNLKERTTKKFRHSSEIILCQSGLKKAKDVVTLLYFVYDSLRH